MVVLFGLLKSKNLQRVLQSQEARKNKMISMNLLTEVFKLSKAFQTIWWLPSHKPTCMRTNETTAV